jgi:hypothetical protein
MTQVEDEATCLVVVTGHVMSKVGLPCPLCLLINVNSDQDFAAEVFADTIQSLR